MTTTREQIIEWARAAKRQAQNAGLDPIPSDESLIRAAAAFNMLTRGPYPVMTINADATASLEFTRAGAIVYMAIAFDDDPPNTPERAALFGVKLDERPPVPTQPSSPADELVQVLAEMQVKPDEAGRYVISYNTITALERHKLETLEALVKRSGYSHQNDHLRGELRLAPPRATKDPQVGDRVKVSYDPLVYMHVTAPPSVATILSFDEDEWVSLEGINGDGRTERFRMKRHKLTRAD